jgi:ribosomal protein S18 acetylase RimI-like enzyme
LTRLSTSSTIREIAEMSVSAPEHRDHLRPPLECRESGERVVKVITAGVHEAFALSGLWRSSRVSPRNSRQDWASRCGVLGLGMRTTSSAMLLKVSAGDDIRIARFDRAMQDAFKWLVLDGMAERWGSVDESLNTDLDDIDIHYGKDCVLVALDGPLVVGTGILLLRAPEGEIVRMSVLRDYRRRGIAKKLLGELLRLASEYGVDRVLVETNAKWTEAQNLYEASGFKFTHSAPGEFGREIFYEFLI